MLLIMPLDTNIFYFLNSLAGKSRAFDILVIFLSQYLQYLLGVLFLIFLYFLQKGKREKICIFLTTIFSIIISRLFITGLIRLFHHRPRPFAFNNVHQLIFPNGYSFPSGHSAFFFAMAAAIFLFNKKMGIIFFAGAILMNVSRIIAGAHYLSDIMAGAIIGIFSAFLAGFLVKRLEEKND